MDIVNGQLLCGDHMTQMFLCPLHPQFLRMTKHQSSNPNQKTFLNPNYYPHFRLNNSMRFTQTNIDFLIDNYPSKGLAYCSENLNIPETSIVTKVRKLKLKLDKSSRSKIRKLTAKLNRETKLSEFTKEFSNIQVYAMGLLWADGCLYKYPNRDAKSLLFKVCSEDYIYFKPSIHSLGVVSERIITLPVGWKEQTNAFIRNYALVDWLYSIGFREKSNTNASAILSEIPKNQHKYFFLGWIDGDGCFYYGEEPIQRQFTVTGPKNYDWSDWTSLLTELGCRHTIKILNFKNSSSSSRIQITDKGSIKLLVDYLYEENFPHLPRKYHKAYLCSL